MFSLKALLDLIFPLRCSVCRKIDPAILCKTCLNQILYINFPYCQRCGIPLDSSRYDLCYSCKTISPFFNISRSIGVYEGVLKKALQAFKFKGKKELGEPLGKIMVNYLVSAPFKLDWCGINLVLPVPLHEKRLQNRGYNQAELLGEIISASLGIPLDTQSLIRSKNTKPQFSLNKIERQKNMQDAFQVCDPGSIKNKQILLIDDIYTTGLTVCECTKVLLQAGALRVNILTLSRAE